MPVPDRSVRELFSASRAVGLVHLWHDSWVDCGITDLDLRTVEERLDVFVARALADV